jgi:ribonuclease H2 subunit B
MQKRPTDESAARLRGAIDHIAQYLPAHITSLLLQSYDPQLAPLATYLANRTAAAAAAAQPAVGDKKAAKGVKRKAPPASRGVEALKKVNTASMSKLTSFFKPKEEKK